MHKRRSCGFAHFLFRKSCEASAHPPLTSFGFSLTRQRLNWRLMCGEVAAAFRRRGAEHDAQMASTIFTPRISLP